MEKNFTSYTLKILRHLSEGILPLIFWVFMVFGFDTPDVAVLTILTALIHELGHIAAIILTRRGNGKLVSHLSGFRIKTSGGGYGAEILTLIGGPLINLLVFLLTLPFGNALGGYISLVGYINLMTSLANLLPVEGYDGYGIIYRLLCMREANRGICYLEYASFFFSVLFTFFSLYLLLRYGSGYWIFGIFFVITVTKINALTKRSVFRE